MKRLLFCILPALAVLNGCVAVVGATNDEPVNLDPNRRTFGTVIDDAQLETVAAVNIDKAHPDLKAAPISVTAYNGVMLLTGQVKNNDLRQRAAEVAANVQGVRQVHNELELIAPTSFLANTNDAWLTTKIKTKLLASKDVRGNRVKVVTENGVVYFMGMLPRSEAEKAAEIARGTSGVQKVVLAVEYTE